MLPAPAQGAITISCRENDDISLSAASLLNDEATQICTKIERDFLRTLLGGCSTPISALAVFENNKVVFKGNVCSVDGKEKFDIYKEAEVKNYNDLGVNAAEELLKNERAREIIYEIRNAK
jgi:hydroxymethylbilane synthase